MERTEIILVLGNPLIAGLLILAICSIAWHMRLGMQIVIEDYVHSEGRKVLLLIANNFFAFGVAAMSIVAILKLSFGG
jgi:succinate dehydrogenase / fumarate reductase membrane anchor subunit